MDKDLFDDICDMLPEKIHVMVTLGYHPTRFCDYVRHYKKGSRVDMALLTWKILKLDAEISKIRLDVEKVCKGTDELDLNLKNLRKEILILIE